MSKPAQAAVIRSSSHATHRDAQLNLQPDRNQAKPYQVRQLLKLVEEYNLSLRKERPRTSPKYHINLFRPEDKAYIADVPDLKCCSAHGKTPEQALKQVLIAIDAWIATAKGHGKKIPKPRYRPAIYAAAS